MSKTSVAPDIEVEQRPAEVIGAVTGRGAVSLLILGLVSSSLAGPSIAGAAGDPVPRCQVLWEEQTGG